MFSGRVRWDKIQSHLKTNLTLLLAPSRGGVIRLKLPLFVCYLLLMSLLAAGGIGYKFCYNYQQLMQVAKTQEQTLADHEKEKQALLQKNQKLQELAKQTEQVQTQVQELAELGEKIQERALDSKLLPERELAKLGWKRSQISSRSRGSRRQVQKLPADANIISQQLTELTNEIPQQKAELQQLLRQIDRYSWLVERYPSQWPVKGRLTSHFGNRIHPLRFRRIFHDGIDIAVPTGTSVRAAASGKVIFAGTRRGYGRTVIIDHGQGLKTLYAHNSRLHVKPGQWVEKGEVICSSGNTGNSTGPHLHFEVQVNGRPKNPLDYLS